jgi:hypothetical protein
VDSGDSLVRRPPTMRPTPTRLAGAVRTPRPTRRPRRRRRPSRKRSTPTCRSRLVATRWTVAIAPPSSCSRTRPTTSARQPDRHAGDRRRHRVTTPHRGPPAGRCDQPAVACPRGSGAQAATPPLPHSAGRPASMVAAHSLRARRSTCRTPCELGTAPPRPRPGRPSVESAQLPPDVVGPRSRPGVRHGDGPPTRSTFCRLWCQGRLKTDPLLPVGN